MATEATDTKPVVEDSESKEKERVSVLRKFQGVSFLMSMGAIGYGSWFMISYSMKMVGTLYAKPHLVMYMGFWGGFTTASLCAALAFSVYRLTHIRPENVFRKTFAELQAHPQVRANLGETIRDAKLKTYDISDGRLEFGMGFPRWIPHKVQMLYMVYGEKGTGLVTTSCRKQMSLIPGQFDVQLLALDVMDKDRIQKDTETIILSGNPADLDVRTNLHQLLDIKLDFYEGKRH